MSFIVSLSLNFTEDISVLMTDGAKKRQKAVNVSWLQICKGPAFMTLALMQPRANGCLWELQADFILQNVNYQIVFGLLRKSRVKPMLAEALEGVSGKIGQRKTVVARNLEVLE